MRPSHQIEGQFQARMGQWCFWAHPCFASPPPWQPSPNLRPRVDELVLFCPTHILPKAPPHKNDSPNCPLGHFAIMPPFWVGPRSVVLIVQQWGAPRPAIVHLWTIVVLDALGMVGYIGMAVPKIAPFYYRSRLSTNPPPPAGAKQTGAVHTRGKLVIQWKVGSAAMTEQGWAINRHLLGQAINWGSGVD